MLRYVLTGVIVLALILAVSAFALDQDDAQEPSGCYVDGIANNGCIP